ncbi:MAG: DUF4399 domain-containing protein [Alphaproteobacteria bacterium]
MHVWARGLLITLLLAGVPAAAQNQPAPPDAELTIIWPPDGQKIEGGRLWVRMGLKGMGIAPAGVVMEGTGHHHFLIDTDLPPLDEPIPADDNHIHFGAGQTEARLTNLTPGEHTLQLILGDDKHFPHNPPVVSKKITITVLPY